MYLEQISLRNIKTFCKQSYMSASKYRINYTCLVTRKTVYTHLLTLHMSDYIIRLSGLNRTHVSKLTKFVKFIQRMSSDNTTKVGFHASELSQ